jgi:hypothetical protein
MHYSPTTGGFYTTAMHGDNMPADAVPITAEEYADLMLGQERGYQITVSENGQPILLPPSPSPPAVPREVTNFQARALLLNMPGSAAGRTMFDDVDDALRARGGVAWQAWEYTTTIPRNSELVAVMASEFGLSDAVLDDMFRTAAGIRA